MANPLRHRDGVSTYHTSQWSLSEMAGGGFRKGIVGKGKRPFCFYLPSKIHCDKMKKDIINRFFKHSALKFFDFSKTNIVYSKQIKKSLNATSENYSTWRAYQIIYLIWNKWSVFANSFNQNGQKNFEKVFNETLRILFLESGFMSGNTLDLGGGCGSLIAYWQSDNKSHYFNQDPNVRTYEYCLGEDDTAIFVEGFAENLPYKDQVFDSILIADALDHFVDPKRALRECSRVLKPNGSLLIVHSFRNEKYAKSIIKRLNTRFMLYLNRRAHNNTFENGEVTAFLETIGFDSFSELNKLVGDSCIEISSLKAVKE
ncbi:MAG: Methyltransferase type 11 [Candidatus Berkelbacteria bacterium]|nr:Methyltransferase type 11 [Candidatus Berkelbacteria bacterium]